jgi:hypothetical protein
MNKLNKLHKIGASSLEHDFKKIGKISSGPGDLEASRSLRASVTSLTVKGSNEIGSAP